MKRVVMLVTLAALMAVVAALSAAPAFAADPFGYVPPNGSANTKYKGEVKETPAGTLDYAVGVTYGHAIGKNNNAEGSISDDKGLNAQGSAKGPVGAFGAADSRVKFTPKQPTGGEPIGGEATTEL